MRARALALLGVMVIPTVTYYAPGVPEILGAVLALVLVRAEPASPFAALGLGRPRSIWRTLALGVALGIAMVLLNRLLLTPLIEHLTGIRRNLAAFDHLRANPIALLTLLPMIWLTAGICEEVIYRAYLVTRIAMLLGGSDAAKVAGCLVGAIVFGLAHWYQGAAGMIATGTMGLLLGLLFLQQRRNLWTNIVTHAVADTASLAAICLGFDRPLDALGRALFGL